MPFPSNALGLSPRKSRTRGTANEIKRSKNSLPGIDIDWAALPDETLVRYANHLAASGSHFASWRGLRRALGAVTLWLSGLRWWHKTKTVLGEIRKTICPGWRKSEFTLTSLPTGGEEKVISAHTWKRRNWRKGLWHRFQSIGHTIGHWTPGKSSG